MEASLTAQVDVIFNGILKSYEQSIETNVRLTEEKMETNSQMIE